MARLPTNDATAPQQMLSDGRCWDRRSLNTITILGSLEQNHLTPKGQADWPGQADASNSGRNDSRLLRVCSLQLRNLDGWQRNRAAVDR